jgi:N-methylhydantoinase A
VFEDVDRPVSCDVYDRASLATGNRISGPAIIEQMDTTTLLPPGFSGIADAGGNLLLVREGPTH